MHNNHLTNSKVVSFIACVLDSTISSIHLFLTAIHFPFGLESTANDLQLLPFHSSFNTSIQSIYYLNRL
jgi:hypothetical protein